MSRSGTGTGAPPSPADHSLDTDAEAQDAVESGAAVELDDAGRALVQAVAEQAELLALLTGSVRAGLPPFASELPSGAVDLIGALGPLEDPAVPGSDPLAAFGAVAPRFARDAEQVTDELGAA